MGQPGLHWLPLAPDFSERLKALRTVPQTSLWGAATALARHNLDFIQTNALDHLLRSHAPDGIRTIRLAVLGSSTTSHLLAALRVAGLRRNLRVVTHEGEYGQYRQDLLDPGSALHRFVPDTVLFALDAAHLAASLPGNADAAQSAEYLAATEAMIVGLWDLARDAFGATILQQAVLPVLPDAMGNNEHRLPGSASAFVERLNARLRVLADQHGAHIVGVDRRAARDGIDSWHDPALWHRSKQEVALGAAPVYGDLVGRLLAALAGRSSKCLVLDLDNTIWGGVIGDDGIDGIVLGQGSATGEAFAELQRYASNLAQRGIILAVCSKNDEAVAWRAFTTHPEMVLKRKQIASFVANWTDKAANIRQIARDLNIGLDALVFVDDNPAERALVRQELAMVAVPEIPEDPALVSRCLADAGYFESVVLTDDDRQRTQQYETNRVRTALAASSTDMDSYLRELDMRLQWRPFDTVGLGRTVQLINKTNQFNLTTRRHTQDDVLAVMADPNAFGLQLRLLDRFGDNGIIAIVVGKADGREIRLDTWLMSCRVLGRQVEQATLNVVVDQARRLRATQVIGEYVPTAANGMVREHFQRLGFLPVCELPDGVTRHRLPIDEFVPFPTSIAIEGPDHDG